MIYADKRFWYLQASPSENDDWFLSHEDIEILEAIGEGQFGTVFKGLLTIQDTDEQVLIFPDLIK